MAPASASSSGVELGGADLERIIIVGDDLDFLLNLPRDRLLTHTEVRLAASIAERIRADGSTASRRGRHRQGRRRGV